MPTTRRRAAAIAEASSSSAQSSKLSNKKSTTAVVANSNNNKITSYFSTTTTTTNTKRGDDGVASPPARTTRSGRTVKRRLDFTEHITTTDDDDDVDDDERDKYQNDADEVKEEKSSENENDDNHVSPPKKKQRRQSTKTTATTPSKKTKSPAASRRRRRSSRYDDEDFVLSDRDEEDEDESAYVEDEVSEPEDLEQQHQQQESSADEDYDDLVVQTPKRRTPTRRASAKKATPIKGTATHVLKSTPLSKAKVTIVKSTPKKSVVKTPLKIAKAPIPKRPAKNLANAAGVVTLGVRTFYVNRSRITGTRKNLIHYVATKEKQNCVNIHYRPDIISSEVTTLLNDDGHTQKTMRLFVDQNPIVQDFTAKKIQPHQPFERTADAYSIDVGESIAINNDTCILMNVGAGSSVWCMDWCHVDIESTQYAVMACHPHHKPFVRVEELYSPDERSLPMDNMLQIWSFGGYVTGEVENSADINARDAVRCVTCIKHNHGFAWDCKWMPSVVKIRNDVSQNEDGGDNDDDDSQTESSTLGILAVAFSDGTLVLYTVPHLDDPPEGSVNCITLQEDQLYTCVHNKDERKLFTALGWSNDCRYLAAGCTDGNLIVWKVDLGATQGQPLLKKIAHVRGHFHRKHGGRVRGISWSSVDPHVFATCGDDGNIRYWDVRDMFEPHCSNLVSRQWATDICYPLNTTGCISVGSDGQVKQFDSRENNFTCVRVHHHPLWSLSFMSTRAAFSYSSAGGTVMISSLEEDAIAKKPKGVAKERIEYVLCDSLVVNEVLEHDDSGSEDDNTVEETINNPSSTHKTNKHSSEKYICLSFPFNTEKKKKKGQNSDSDHPVTVIDATLRKQRDNATSSLHIGEPQESPASRTNKSKKTPTKKKSASKTEAVSAIPDHSLSIFSVRYHHSRHKQLRNWCIFGGQAGYVCALKVPDKL